MIPGMMIHHIILQESLLEPSKWSGHAKIRLTREESATLGDLKLVSQEIMSDINAQRDLSAVKIISYASRVVLNT
jgi:hypothetical protein